MARVPPSKPSKKVVLPAKLGRKRDAELDDVILSAAVEVLIEHGYAGMTMDLVAAKAQSGKASLYRRWASKLELTKSAVERLSGGQRQDTLPDTGTLRGDLLALLSPDRFADGEKLLKVMLAIGSDAEVANVARAASAAPWVARNVSLIQRAIDRGEVSSSTDVARMAQVLPSLASYQVAIERKPIDAPFMTHAIDKVLLPALLHGSAMSPKIARRRKATSKAVPDGKDGP